MKHPIRNRFFISILSLLLISVAFVALKKRDTTTNITPVAPGLEHQTVQQPLVPQPPITYAQPPSTPPVNSQSSPLTTSRDYSAGKVMGSSKPMTALSAPSHNEGSALGSVGAFKQSGVSGSGGVSTHHEMNKMKGGGGYGGAVTGGQDLSQLNVMSATPQEARAAVKAGRGGSYVDSYTQRNYSAPGTPFYNKPYGYTPYPNYNQNYNQSYNRGYNYESYKPIKENEYERVSAAPLSTFSIDVDAASYANVRRYLLAGSVPPPDAVRIEELINYFQYDYPNPSEDEPCNIVTNLATCPWKAGHELLHVGIKARDVDLKTAPANNIVFLLDVSGSMADANRLPLVQRACHMLVEQMRPRDRIAVVTYASYSGVALPSTSGRNKETILNVIDQLRAGGSTNGGEGIQTAYRLAEENFISNGNNRIILATDGDFNVGISNDADLVRMIEEKRKSGVFLTVLGVGTGNLQDAKMMQLADKGNGHYYYLDNILEAQKVLVSQLNGTLLTVAKDVKVQVEFNPAKVQAYRLIGYEKRMLAKEDFNNDKKDAGEMGAGHTVTALYEIIPAGSDEEVPQSVDPLRYQTTKEKGDDDFADEWVMVKVRYKEPNGETSKLIKHPVSGFVQEFYSAPEQMRFAGSVALFGMLLRDSENKGSGNFDQAIGLARGSMGYDPEGLRHEFVRLAEVAKSLKGNPNNEYFGSR